MTTPESVAVGTLRDKGATTPSVVLYRFLPRGAGERMGTGMDDGAR